MADQAFQDTGKNPANPTDPTSRGFEKMAGSATQAADQVLSAGRDLKNKAMDMAGASTEAIKNQASDFAEAAKNTASQAADKLKEAADGQKNAGAEYVGNLADTMRRAAREFDNDLPIAGTYIRKLASHADVASDSIKNGNFNDLLRGTQDFARRQPTAFLGMAVLAGFGAVRFLKSSAQTSQAGESDVSGGARGDASRWNDNKGYRDGFSK